MNPHSIHALFLLAATTVAQTPPPPVALPMPASAVMPSSVPFGTTRIRWQAWIDARQLVNAIGRPVRMTRLDFQTATGGQTGPAIEMEVRVANSLAFPSANFQANMVSGETLVHPAVVGAPRTFFLSTTIAGQFVLQIPFQNEFVWDGESAIVIDVRIFDNGNSNIPFSYDIAVEQPVFGSPTQMLWDNNDNPTAVSANQFPTRPSRGPRVQLHFADGVTVTFGAGCPGAGFNVPVASTNGIPQPANVGWTHVLTNAASQRQAIWMFGDSREQWAGVTLPFSLDILGAPNCELLVKPDLTATLTTVGGGAGAGTVSLTTPVPPVTSMVGMSFFTQWLVLDPFAINGVLAVSNGQWHVFGP